MPSLTITSQAAGTGTAGYVITNDPVTYHDGLFTALRVQAPASLLSATQGWVAMRVKMGYASASVPSGVGPLFEFGTDANDRVGCYLSPAQLLLYRYAGGSVTSNLVNMTYAAGDVLTFVLAWTATHLYVSVNGGAFASTGNTLIPSLSNPTFLIGELVWTTNYVLDSSVLWFACGTGTLSNADAATINGFGNIAPTFVSFASSAQADAIWAATSSTFDLVSYRRRLGTVQHLSRRRQLTRWTTVRI